jgi:chromosome segregation ATPase
MSQKEGENLPSVNDFLQNQEDLPSLDSFKEENLPSIEEFVVQPEENNSETIEDANGESFLEVIDVVKAPEWQELVRLVNDVRKDIPEIPEIKYYDDELGDLSEKIIEIQDNLSRFDLKSDKIYNLDAKNEEFEVKLTEIESKIPEIPEIKQYDGDIEYIYKKIDIIKEEISSLPEVKYYESDLEALKTKIQDVKESIPTFPDWVQKVEEVPDFSWIGKTFSIIDDDFNKVQGHLDLIKEKIDFRVSELNDNIETKDFELKVDVKNIIENHQEVKNNIFNELKETSVKVWEHHREFKDDDRKLKKAVLSEQNKLKQSLQEQIKEIDSQSVKADEALLKFFTELKETVDVIPEVKYYDEDISNLREEINKEIKSTKGDVQTLIGELYKIASVIKKQQKTISEGYLLEDNPNLPGDPSTNNSSDGLTPLDQKFATLDDQLQNHYRLIHQ